MHLHKGACAIPGLKRGAGGRCVCVSDALKGTLSLPELPVPWWRDPEGRCYEARPSDSRVRLTLGGPRESYSGNLTRG